MASLIAKTPSPNGTGWAERHNEALHVGVVYLVPTHESSMVQMLRGWENYAVAHKRRYESPIGNDYVLGPEWRSVGLAIRGLLNGETGRLDCGTLDAFILDTLAENGIDMEKL